MTTITFDYKEWDPTKETIPRREAGGTTARVDVPFTVEDLLVALFSEQVPNKNDPLRAEIIKALQANLTQKVGPKAR